MSVTADIRHWPTLTEFEAHLAAHDPAICQWAHGLTVHHTYIPTVDQWHARSSIDGMKSFYEGKGWSGAPHIYVAPDGLWQLNPLHIPGIHAGPCNKDHWGVEVVGNYDHTFWQEPIRSLAYGAICALLRWRGLAADTIKGHRECMPHQKTCPGSAIDLDRLRADVDQRLSVFATPAPVPVPIPPATLITADTTLISPPRASADLAIAYLNLRGSVYTVQDITKIVGYYWTFGPDAGIDPLLAIAQCIHETSAQNPDTNTWRPLSSWWAQRPRRNPCGYGVTGATQHERPADVLGWTQDTAAGIWRQGLSFGSWEWSVQAHIGRLLLYAIKEGTGTETQRKRMAYAHGLRPLPEHMMGSAPTLAPLGAAHNPTGHGWADPGEQYGAQIAAIANAILQVRP